MTDIEKEAAKLLNWSIVNGKVYDNYGEHIDMDALGDNPTSETTMRVVCGLLTELQTATATLTALSEVNQTGTPNYTVPIVTMQTACKRALMLMAATREGLTNGN